MPEQLLFNGLSFPDNDGIAGSALTTNGDGSLTWALITPQQPQFVQADFIGILSNGTRSLIRSAPAGTIQSITVQTRSGTGVISIRLNNVDVPDLVQLPITATPTTFEVPIVLADGDVLKWYKHSGDLDSVYISYMMVLGG